MKCTRSSVRGAWDNAGLQAACDGCANNLLHTCVIVSTSSTSEWPGTSVLGFRREEIRIKCGFHRKKTSCTVENGGVHRKNKLYGGCNV